MSKAYLYDVIRSPVITEKATQDSENNKKYIFKIRPSANKKQVKEAIEFIFNVKVESVNTINVKGKIKRFRGRLGKRADLKKAIVTLFSDQVIKFTAGV